MEDDRQAYLVLVPNVGKRIGDWWLLLVNPELAQFRHDLDGTEDTWLLEDMHVDAHGAVHIDGIGVARAQ